MPDTPTVAELFRLAANRLRVEFESYREGSFHSGQMGAEVETVLRNFLDAHLPRRFGSSSAFLIDGENNVSKQCDVAIYDALSSPVLRSSPVQQILPVDHVAAVVEVKSSLNKNTLTDAYAKIASCKRLKKTALTKIDVAATGSELSTVGTLGIVFAFASDTSLLSLAENARDLNKEYESNLWPDFIFVLDKGSIGYMMQLPWEHKLGGMMMPPCGEEFAIPAAYLILAKLDDGPLTLNRFFIVLLSQLTFFPHRPSTMRFAQVLGQPQDTAITVQGYQYNTNCRLNVVPPEENGKRRTAAVEYKVVTTDGVTRAQLGYYVWQDGGFITARGIPLAPLVSMMMPGAKATVMPINDGECSSVLQLTEKEFRDWPDRFAKMPPPANLRLEPLDRTTGQ
jgi:hypothetical protein